MSDLPPTVSTESDPEPEPQPQPQPQSPPYTLQPRRSLLRLLTEHNPFYLISAACMLASCLALTNSLSWTSIPRTRLLTLILTLNVYEAALLAIALFLIKSRKLRRDGRILLLLQAFFLADFSFLNAEIATGTNVWQGLGINLLLLVLAAAKMGVVLWVLKPGVTPMQFGFVMLQLAVLFVTPVVLRWVDAQRALLSERDFYVVWWVVGLLPAAYELLARLDRGRIASVSPDAQVAPVTAYAVLPFVSLLLHFGIIHWVYRVNYVGAHAGPLLLGLALVLNRFSPTTLVPRKDLFALRLLLPAAAVLVSMNNPFVFDLGNLYPRLVLTPLNLTVGGAFLVYFYSFLMPYARLVLAAAAAVAVAYFFGPTWQQIGAYLDTAWSRGVATAERMMPRTLGEWGVVGLVASFAFLAIGFALSLRKQPEAHD